MTEDNQNTLPLMDSVWSEVSIYLQIHYFLQYQTANEGRINNAS